MTSKQYFGMVSIAKGPLREYQGSAEAAEPSLNSLNYGNVPSGLFLNELTASTHHKIQTTKGGCAFTSLQPHSNHPRGTRRAQTTPYLQLPNFSFYLNFWNFLEIQGHTRGNSGEILGTFQEHSGTIQGKCRNRGLLFIPTFPTNVCSVCTINMFFINQAFFHQLCPVFFLHK